MTHCRRAERLAAQYDVWYLPGSDLSDSFGMRHVLVGQAASWWFAVDGMHEAYRLLVPDACRSMAT